MNKGMNECSIRSKEFLNIPLNARGILNIAFFITELTDIIYNCGYFGEISFRVEQSRSSIKSSMSRIFQFSLDYFP
jgi:hypothetical protein